MDPVTVRAATTPAVGTAVAKVVNPGESWAFTEHRTMAEVMAAERRSPGRARVGNHNNQAMLLHDSRHPAAKFTDATVRRIRRRRADGVSSRMIADALGCHTDTINRIVRG